MALIGLVRVSTAKQETQRPHDALDPICERVFEEKVSGKLVVDQRPGLKSALNFMRDGDMLAVQEVDRLGRNLLEGLVVLNELFQRGCRVKVLAGIAAGEHTERSFLIDMALALAEDRRRDISRKIKNGLEAARKLADTRYLPALARRIPPKQGRTQAWLQPPQLPPDQGRAHANLRGSRPPVQPSRNRGLTDG
ncbi:site-specific recombinase PinR [Mycobacteroides abscessus subsp. bolletii]|nr:site-specific recombinase PinR [Mycobacteroides abscessus subsp. bolletii]